MNTDLWDLYRFGDGYACHETNRAWMAWQASREALVVEMPQKFFIDGVLVVTVTDLSRQLDKAGIKWK